MDLSHFLVLRQAINMSWSGSRAAAHEWISNSIAGNVGESLAYSAVMLAPIPDLFKRVEHSQTLV